MSKMTRLKEIKNKTKTDQVVGPSPFEVNDSEDLCQGLGGHPKLP